MRLIEKPVADGRHRLLWLVLAPFAVNVLKLPRDVAIKFIEGYLRECQQIAESEAIGLIDYYVDYALARNLQPLSKEKAKIWIPELAEIIEKC